MEKNNIDFENIISKAYETLIIQDNLLFPLDVFNIKLNLNMKIISFDELAQISSTSYEQIKELSQNADAFKYEQNGILLIVYDNKIQSLGRKRWSIAHEYGHVVLNHRCQSDQNEIEANFFAANLLLPQCILKELLIKRGDITKDYLKGKFSISEEAATKYLARINGRGFDYFKNEYDDIILEKSKKFLDNEIRNSRLFQLQLEDEMQEKRGNWMYE
jgi:hypothetical protein